MTPKQLPSRLREPFNRFLSRFRIWDKHILAMLLPFVLLSFLSGDFRITLWSLSLYRIPKSAWRNFWHCAYFWHRVVPYSNELNSYCALYTFQGFCSACACVMVCEPGGLCTWHGGGGGWAGGGGGGCMYVHILAFSPEQNKIVCF